MARRHQRTSALGRHGVPSFPVAPSSSLRFSACSLLAMSPAIPESPALPSQGCPEPLLSPQTRVMCWVAGSVTQARAPGCPGRGRTLYLSLTRHRHALPRPKCRLRSGSWGSGYRVARPGHPAICHVPAGQRAPASALVVLGRPRGGPGKVLQVSWPGGGCLVALTTPTGLPRWKSSEEMPQPPGGEWRSALHGGARTFDILFRVQLRSLDSASSEADLLSQCHRKAQAQHSLAGPTSGQLGRHVPVSPPPRLSRSSVWRRDGVTQAGLSVLQDTPGTDGEGLWVWEP